ncbi:MAG: hypothetical protein WBF83_03785, partial [Moheibacter sp.]
YSFLPVNLYTGRIDVNVPIYTIKQGTIEYPISLNYQGGGIKVDQRASNIGLGWSMTQTVITRKIQGGNDLNDYSNRTSEINSDLWIREVEGSWSGYGKTGYFKQSSEGVKLTNFDGIVKKVDFFPDIYNFYSPEFNTSFYFENINTPIEINYQQTKIVPNQPSFQTFNYMKNSGFPNHPTKDIYGFTLTSDNGIKYILNDYTVSYNDVMTSWGTGEHVLPEVSSWLVSRIEDPATNSKIFFQYEEYDADIPSPIYGEHPTYPFSFSYIKMPPNNQNCQYNATFYQDFPGNQSPYYNKVRQRKIRQKRLKKIIFDLGEVEFLYDTVNRLDEYKEKALKNIIIKDYNGKVLFNYQLTHDYFQSNCPNEYSYPQDCKRLKLSNVKNIIGDYTGSYNFSYYEELSLPKINSSASDFLGYFNNSPEVNIESMLPIPKLYFYPNKDEYSVLPFLVPNQNYHIVNQNSIVDKTPNNHSKSWSLKKVTYPTGGSTEFEYESGDFNFWGQNIKGGGARIKSQSLFDNNGTLLQTLNYEYKDSQGNSSGTLHRVPFYGLPAYHLFNSYYQENGDGSVTLLTDYNGLPNWDADNLGETFLTFQNDRSEEDITNGGYVGYKYIKEYEVGNGYTNYEYTSNLDFPDKLLRTERILPIHINTTNYNTCIGSFLQTNSALGYSLYTDYSLFRGKLKNKKTYNQNNLIVQEIINTYQNYNYDFKQFIGIDEYTNYLGDLSLFFSTLKDYRSENYLLTNTINNQYSLTGTNPISESKTLTYNGANNLIRTSSLEINNQEHIHNIYSYPEASSNDPTIQQLVQQNRKSTVLQQSTEKNMVPVSTTKVEFKNNQSTNYLTLPSKLLYNKSQELMKTDIEYLEYDNKGNVIRYKEKNGTNTYIIMGYKKQYPLMIISGGTEDYYYYYDDLSQAVNVGTGYSFQYLQTLSDSENSQSEEMVLISIMKTIQNWLSLNRNTLVEFYTYDPLVGITSETFSNGITIFYIYDNNGRVIQLTDEQGNILKKVDYNYKQP